MSPKRRLAAVALSALLVLSVVGPAIAVAQTDEETGGGLSVDVRNSGDDVVVVVEDENGSVDGATVTVSAVEETDDETDDEEETDNETTDDETTDNETDDEEEIDNETSDDETDGGTSDNETDDGTSDNETTDRTTDNETTDNETDGGYAGEGTYTTGADGTVELPAPDNGVRLQISVDAGNRTTTSEVTVNDGVGVPFGQRVALLVQQLLQGDGNVTVGQAVSEFVRGNNPGNAPADAGPPEDRGNDSDAERGPPEDRGNGSDAERGPPEDRGNGSDAEHGPPEDRGSDDNDGDAERGPPEDHDDDDDGDDDNDDDGDDGDDGAERGPPEDRGN